MYRYILTGDYSSDLERRAHLAQRVLEAEDEDERADGRRLAEDARMDQSVAQAPALVARLGQGFALQITRSVVS